MTTEREIADFLAGLESLGAYTRRELIDLIAEHFGIEPIVSYGEHEGVMRRGVERAVDEGSLSEPDWDFRYHVREQRDELRK